MSGEVDGSILVVIGPLFTKNLCCNDKECAIYLIRRSDMPYFESTKDDIFLKIEDMNDIHNAYVSEARKEMRPRRFEQYRNGKLLVINPYLEIVSNSNAQILKIIINENETDNIDCINNFLKH